jgi:phage-related protein
MGDSLDSIRTFPADVRADGGYQLELVQRRERPADFRPMPEVGQGVIEIRLHSDGEYRILYVARFEEAVYVLHCFGKKTRTTRRGDIDLAKQRYRALLERRKKK